MVLGRVYAGDTDVSEEDAEGHENDGDALLIPPAPCSPPAYDAPPPRPATTAPQSRACASAPPAWMWIRPVGCDVPPGDIILAAGETVWPAHLALAQVGTRMEDVRVRRWPRVGNEVAVGTDEGPGRAGGDAFLTPTPRCC